MTENENEEIQEEDALAEADQAERMEEVSQKMNDKKSTRNWWIKTVLMLLLIAASIVVMFGIAKYVSDDGSTSSFVVMVQNANPWYALLLLGVLLVYIVVESMKYAYLIRVSTGKWLIRASIKTMFLGKYYDGITPLSTGGQPFQILYLHKKHDVPSGVATAVPLVRYIVSAIVITITSIVLLGLTPLFIENAVLKTTFLVVAWISLAINLMFPVGIILFSVSPKKTGRMIAGIVNGLAKMHIVKHKLAVMTRFQRELREYSRSLKMFLKKIKYIPPLVLLALAECLINYSVPFFAVIAIAGLTPTFELWIQLLCLSVVTRYVALLIPTPGNTGAVEAAGSLVFITIVNNPVVTPVLGWIVLVWRFLTYYMYILSGIGINIFEIIRGAVRRKRAQKTNTE